MRPLTRPSAVARTIGKATEDPEEGTLALAAQLARGGGVAGLGTAVGKALQLGFHVLLGRMLGAAGYGLFALGFAAFQIAGQLAMGGLQHGLVRFIGADRARGNPGGIRATWGSALQIGTAFSLFAGAILFLTAPFLAATAFNKPELASILRGFAVAIPPFVWLQLSAHTARGAERVGQYTGLAHLLLPSANFLFVGGAFLLGYRLSGAVWGYVLSVSLCAAAALALTRIWVRRLLPMQGSRKRTRDLLRFSCILVPHDVGMYILSQTGPFIIGALLAADRVGVYSAASRVAVQLGMVFTALNLVFAPMISRLWSAGRVSELGDTLRTLTRWAVTLTIPGALVLVLLSKWIMALYGTEFASGTIALGVLVFGQLANVATGSVGLVLLMCGRQKVELGNVFGMLAIQVILQVVLVRSYGILGAAIASALAIGLVNGVRVLEVRLFLGIHPYSRRILIPLLAGFVAAGVAAAVLLLLHWHELAALGVSTGTYLIALLIAGFSPIDRALLRSLARRSSHSADATGGAEN